MCEGLCAAGYYCPAGSVSPYAVPCGAVNMYCPPGSAAPLPVAPGYFSTPESVSEVYRHGQEPCPPGHYCENAKKYACPAGTYTDVPMTTSPQCRDLCAPGYYCMEGSDNPKQHVCGHAGVICPRGSATPLPVLNGFYSVHSGTDRPPCVTR
jgi:hypothetical protein